MNITVYLGANPGREAMYQENAYRLGSWIASHGHTLIYGGSRTGLMGSLADGAIAKGGKVIGIEPRCFVDDELQHDGLTQLIVTDDMTSRKEKMMELGDVFLAFPGGIGTLEEISQVLSQIRLGFLDGRAAFLDFGGYYQPLKAYLEHMAVEEFIQPEFVRSIPFLTDFNQLEEFINA